jgi:hypothetical protein
LRVGDSRKKIVKRDDRYTEDASRTLRLINTRRWRRNVMSEPPTMPLVHRFGISHMPVSREFAREWQFNGLPTIRPSDFPEADLWPASIRCREQNGLLIRDYVRDGDISTTIRGLARLGQFPCKAATRE